jgi:hypothetical protein
VCEFQSYTESIYLNRLLDKFDESFIKAEFSRKKTYVIDQGLGTAMDFKFAQDLGRLLENTVCIELINTCKRYHLDRGTILCMDQEEEFSMERVFIQVISAWRYLSNL